MRNVVIAAAIAAVVTAAVTTRISARQDDMPKQMVGPMERDVVHVVSFCGSHEYFAPGLARETSWFYMKPKVGLGGGWAEVEYSELPTKDGTGLQRPYRGTFNLNHLCYSRRAADPMEVR